MTYKNPKQIILSNQKFCLWYCSCVLSKPQMADFTCTHFGTSGSIAQFLQVKVQVMLYRLGSCHKSGGWAKLCIDQCFSAVRVVELPVLFWFCSCVSDLEVC
jgi:hypothetical protein